MKLLEIHHAQITVPKGAENEARRFYCDILGLQEIPKPQSLSMRGGLWLELGGKQIHIGTEVGAERGNSKAHIAYLVDDLESWRECFNKVRVETVDGAPIPGYRRFEFRDPFGNRVEFLQPEA